MSAPPVLPRTDASCTSAWHSLQPADTCCTGAACSRTPADGACIHADGFRTRDDGRCTPATSVRTRNGAFCTRAEPIFTRESRVQPHAGRVLTVSGGTATACNCIRLETKCGARAFSTEPSRSGFVHFSEPGSPGLTTRTTSERFCGGQRWIPPSSEVPETQKQGGIPCVRRLSIPQLTRS